MTTSFQSYQLTLPQVSVWRINSEPEVTEAKALIELREHNFFKPKHLYFGKRADEEYWTITPERLVVAKGELRSTSDEGAFSAMVLQVGYSIVTSSNGKACVLSDLPEDFDVLELPSFLLAPHLIPLG